MAKEKEKRPPKPVHFPAYRIYKLRKGIRGDRELARKAGLAEQTLIHWVCLPRPLPQEKAEKLAAFLDCEVTEIWDPETGRPIMLT